MVNKKYTLFLLCGLFHQSLLTKAKDQYLASQISSLHMSSFSPIEIQELTQEEKDAQEKNKSLFSKLTGLDDPDFSIQRLDDHIAYNIVYNMFSLAPFEPTESIYTKTTWKDLELFCGDHIKETHLVATLDRTITRYGHVFLTMLLANPTTNISDLKQRQEIIQLLLNTKLLANHLEKALQEVKAVEDGLLYLWKEETNKTNQMFLKNIYYQINPFDKLNYSTFYQETTTNLKRTSQIAIPLFLMPTYLLYNFKKSLGTEFYYQTLAMLKQIVKESSFKDKCLLFGPFTLFAAYQAFTIKMGYDDAVRFENLLNYLHEQVNSAATVFKTLNLVHQASKKYPTLKKLKSFTIIENIASQKNISEEFSRLASLTNKKTFTGKPTFFSLKGRVRVAYKLLTEIKNELVPALYALGEIDALLSITKLYQEYQAQEIGYTFPTYSDADTPIIQMVDMWNPFVGAEKSVKNSITLGNDAKRNIILTGPNAGGKSTFLKGLTLNILLAQTLGIAPARELIFTPFAKINTYMNITDDTAGGKSLFKSEVLRAQELIKTVTTLDKNQFSLSIMDEMFSGTSPKEGAAASYAVAKNLGNQNNSILLLATHFPLLTKLEQDTQNFTNYQVRVVRHEDETFSYPFKLEAGIANQNIALDIIQQQGFESSILKDAQNVLNSEFNK